MADIIKSHYLHLAGAELSFVVVIQLESQVFSFPKVEDLLFLPIPQ